MRNRETAQIAAAIAGDYEAEVWCEFDKLAYGFIGKDLEDIDGRIEAMNNGEEDTWDYVRPLSYKELHQWCEARSA